MKPIDIAAMDCNASFRKLYSSFYKTKTVIIAKERAIIFSLNCKTHNLRVTKDFKY